MSVIFKDGRESFKKNLATALDKALVESAVMVQGEAAVRCPVDTGHLRGSLNYRVSVSSGGTIGESTDDGLTGAPEKGEAVIGTNVEYAPHVEYGTIYQKPQSYMRAGASAAMPNVRRRFKTILGTVEATDMEDREL